jgi:hypothetical protein
MDPLGIGCGSQEIHGAPFGNHCSSRYIRADGQKEGTAWLALAFENFRLLMPQDLPLQQHKLSYR